MLRPVVLVVLDGWGISGSERGNAILEAQTPNIDKVSRYYPHIAVQASGISVGLPWGEPGNSEVGHMTLGTGKVIYQSMPRITMAIQDGEFFKNQSFLRAIEHAKKNNSSLHIMGLVGKGSVHSNMDHLYALLELAGDQKFDRVFIHVFTDGRDSSPTSGVESIKELQSKLKAKKIGRISTIAGRNFAMDRNNNWDRVQKSYDAMVKGSGVKTTDPEDYVRKSYAREIFDEYLEPAIVCEQEQPIGLIKDNDAIIFFNYREDRARQMTKAFVLPGFSKFPRLELKNIHFVTMTQYEDNLPVDIAYGPIEITGCLGEILSKNKLTQLRVAETEKFAHVTYFFNGGNEAPFPGEERVIIPSKAVSTYDQCPQMSAAEVAEEITKRINQDKYDFILLNFANADMVGHTGNEKASIAAVETIDFQLAQIIKTVLLKKGCLLITADHGNAEEIINVQTGEIDTEHSSNPVPLWFVTSENHRDRPEEAQEFKVSGLLSDIAPTILDLFKIKKPKTMTGDSLLEILK